MDWKVALLREAKEGLRRWCPQVGLSVVETLLDSFFQNKYTLPFTETFQVVLYLKVQHPVTHVSDWAVSR